MQVALKWQVQQKIPVIPKSANPEHQKENLDLFGWELTADEMAQLSAAAKPQVAGDVGPGGEYAGGRCDGDALRVSGGVPPVGLEAWV